MLIVGLLYKSDVLVMRLSPANEEMIDVMWYMSAVGADVEASILPDPTLV